PETRALLRTSERVVAIGTSTGGTLALEEVLTALPRVTPGIVIVQHMPEKFTAAFADRLNGLCQIEVREARHGDRVLPGR
ncbi:chemotaxis protein CheB, partial [Massilia sp. CT11-108]|uniref:chemotaxis protein CheB n=1 Tax=Massilia sp. CT11-108 TaxID=3393900 RepID=UPI0039A50D13